MAEDTEITAAELAEWADLLDELLATVRRRGAPWTETLMSQARVESRQTAATRRPDGSLWGPEPYGTVYAAAEMLFHAVFGHVWSLRQLIDSGTPPPASVDAVARSALEAASTIWWLTVPAVTGRQRVARLYLLRRATAGYYEQFAEKMNVAPGSVYGDLVADLDVEYKDTLGLKDTFGEKGKWVGSEGQQLPGYTRRAKDYFRAIGQPGTGAVYSFLSGASHGELWRIRYGYTEKTSPNGESGHYQYMPRGLLRVAVGVAVESLVYSIGLPFDLLGRMASIGDVWRLAGWIKTAFAYVE